MIPRVSGKGGEAAGPETTPATSGSDELPSRSDSKPAGTGHQPAAAPATDPARIYGPASTSIVNNLGLDGALIAILLGRIEMMQSDLSMQVAEMQQRNQLKKLYNEKIGELNDMLTDLGNQKVSGDATGHVAVKEKMVTTWDEGVDANGNPTLAAHKGAETVGKEMPGDGSVVEVSPNAIKTAIEKLRGRVDSLNTDGEINNLRMQSYFRSIETAVSETSQLIKSKGDLQRELARNIA
ncbi:MAG TPA: hypothetical protein VGQ83_31750 [Polyangia bacterium]|jgi:hypothetical protein